MSDVCICICLYIYIYILWASSCRYFLARESMRQCIYGTSCKIMIFEELCVPSAGPPPKTSSGIPSGQDVSEKWRHGVTHTLVSVYGFVLIRVRTISWAGCVCHLSVNLPSSVRKLCASNMYRIAWLWREVWPIKDSQIKEWFHEVPHHWPQKQNATCILSEVNRTSARTQARILGCGEIGVLQTWLQ